MSCCALCVIPLYTYCALGFQWRNVERIGWCKCVCVCVYAFHSNRWKMLRSDSFGCVNCERVKKFRFQVTCSCEIQIRNSNVMKKWCINWNPTCNLLPIALRLRGRCHHSTTISERKFKCKWNVMNGVDLTSMELGLRNHYTQRRTARSKHCTICHVDRKGKIFVCIFDTSWQLGT